MTLDEAIKILGLNRNFTEEDLKTAYRKLAQLHHPDRHENSQDREREENIMKDINAAKDYLMKYLKNNVKTNSNTNTEEEIKRKRKELERIVSIGFMNQFTFKFVAQNRIIKYILDELKTMPTKFYLRSSIAKTNIDELYNEFLNKIKEKFKELEVEFFKVNYIDKSDIKENINYDCTLKEFCEQLIKFKDKYSKESILKKKLEEELLKYTYFYGFETIETQIREAINGFANKIKTQKFKYTQNDIDNLNKEITGLFNKFFNLKQKIDTIEKHVKKINNEKITEKFELIKNNLYSGYPLDAFDKQILELEKLIEEYMKEITLKSTFEENEKTINDIYKRLIERYSKAIQCYKITTYTTAVEETTKLLNELLQLFIAGCKQYKDLDFFSLFNEITFKYSEKDDKIIRKIHSLTKDKKSKVYIKFNIEGIWDEYSFFWFDEENMTIYRIRNVDTIDSEKINFQQLTEDYIALEDFLDESTFVGKYKMKRNTEVVGLIYEGFGYSIYLEKDKFNITKDTSSMGISNRNNEYLNRFKDKKYTHDMIEEQLREVVEKYKKKSIPTGYNIDYRMNNNYKINSKIYGEPEYNSYGDFRRRRQK